VACQLCQVKNSLFEHASEVLYNSYINSRESHMTDTEFFKFDQDQWFQEYMNTQLSKNFENTNPHGEKFEFDDVPW
jgi:hypothetical protein